MGACCVCYWARMFLLGFHSRGRDARPLGPRFSLPCGLQSDRCLSQGGQTLSVETFSRKAYISRSTMSMNGM